LPLRRTCSCPRRAPVPRNDGITCASERDVLADDHASLRPDPRGASAPRAGASPAPGPMAPPSPPEERRSRDPGTRGTERHPAAHRRTRLPCPDTADDTEGRPGTFPSGRSGCSAREGRCLRGELEGWSELPRFSIAGGRGEQCSTGSRRRAGGEPSGTPGPFQPDPAHARCGPGGPGSEAQIRGCSLRSLRGSATRGMVPLERVDPAESPTCRTSAHQRDRPTQAQEDPPTGARSSEVRQREEPECSETAREMDSDRAATEHWASLPDRRRRALGRRSRSRRTAGGRLARHERCGTRMGAAASGTRDGAVKRRRREAARRTQLPRARRERSGRRREIDVQGIDPQQPDASFCVAAPDGTPLRMHDSEGTLQSTRHAGHAGAISPRPFPVSEDERASAWTPTPWR
jgi:hypothetical protein